MIECVPAASEDVANVAAPPASVPVPSEVAPSRNVTVPVIVPAVTEVTVAVNVTFAPVVEGLSEDAASVVVEALVPTFTVCVNAGEVLAVNFVSPLYFAVMECIPCIKVVVESAELPAMIVTGAPICVAPSKNVSVPVSVPAVAEVDVAMNMTFCPTVAGFTEETTVVVVAAVAVALIVCVIAGEVLAENFASPL